VPAEALVDEREQLQVDLVEPASEVDRERRPVPVGLESLDEADRLTRFFFGDELADRVRRENWLILPEDTGIWCLGLATGIVA